MSMRLLRVVLPIIMLAPLLATGSVSAQDARFAPRAGLSFAQPLIDEASFGLIRGTDSNAFAVFSKERKRWSTYHFPKHLRVKPWTLGEFGPKAAKAIIGFEYMNGPVAELVAVDTKGRFRKYTPDEPLYRELRPVLIGDAVLYYIADGTIYAFSGVTGTWDSLQAPGLPDVQWKDGKGVQPDVQEHGFDTESIEGILVMTPRGTMKFSANVGAWQLADDAASASR